MNKNITSLLAGLFLMILISVVISCTEIKKDVRDRSKKNEINPQLITLSDTSLQLMNVTLERPLRKAISSLIYLNGKIVALPNYRASVTADIEGKIEKINVREGDFVRKGQILMTLRSIPFIELQNQFTEAVSELDFLSIEYARQEELIKNNVGALAEFQTTESKLKASRSKVAALRAKLKLLGADTQRLESSPRNEISPIVSIAAPIDGHLIQLPINVGMLATTNMTLAELVDTRELMAQVNAFDNDLDDVREGQEVQIDFINHSFPSVKGTVTHLGHAFDPVTRSVRIQVHFTSPPGALVLPDMSVRCAVIKTESTAPQLTVPAAAVIQEEDHHFVFITYPAEKVGMQNILHKSRVTLGRHNEKEVQIEFANEPTGDYLVATQNAMIVENERKKKSGMTFQ